MPHIAVKKHVGKMCCGLWKVISPVHSSLFGTVSQVQETVQRFNVFITVQFWYYETFGTGSHIVETYKYGLFVSA